MSKENTVHARKDADVKAEATAALNAMGLTPSDAIRMLFKRIAAEKALPFEVRVPNTQTQAAINELEAGQGESFESVDDLMKDLNAPD